MIYTPPGGLNFDRSNSFELFCIGSHKDHLCQIECIFTIYFIEDVLNFLYRYLRETDHTPWPSCFGGSNLVGLIL